MKTFSISNRCDHVHGCMLHRVKNTPYCERHQDGRTFLANLGPVNTLLTGVTYEGPYAVHRTAQVQKSGEIRISETAWTVSRVDTGKRVRGGFLTFEAAWAWAKQGEGDALIRANIGYRPHPTIVDAFQIVAYVERQTEPDWLGESLVVGRKRAAEHVAEWHIYFETGKFPKNRSRVRQAVAVNTKDPSKKRGFTYTVENLLRRDIRDASDSCTGPCKCNIETDGTCPNGWESRLRAARLL